METIVIKNNNKNKRNNNTKNRLKRRTRKLKKFEKTIEKVGAKVSKLAIRKELARGKQKYINCGDYLYCLRYPSLGMGGKVPGQFGKATITKNIHCTVSTTVGALGFAAICFVPYFLHDDASTSTSLTIMNGATYDGVSVFTNWTGIATPMQCPAGNVQEYRLVGAEMQVIGQQPLQTGTGKIMGGLTDIAYAPTTVGGAGTVPNALATNATVDNFRPFAEADCCIPENLRLVWRPVDDLDFGMYDINEMENATAYRETALVANIVGAPAGAKFNIELYWIFEYVPQPGSVNSGCGSYCDDINRPSEKILPYLKDDTIWVQTFIGAHQHTQLSRNMQVQPIKPKSMLGKSSQFDPFTGYPYGMYPY